MKNGNVVAGTTIIVIFLVGFMLVMNVTSMDIPLPETFTGFSEMLPYVGVIGVVVFTAVGILFSVTSTISTPLDNESEYTEPFPSDEVYFIDLESGRTGKELGFQDCTTCGAPGGVQKGRCIYCLHVPQEVKI